MERAARPSASRSDHVERSAASQSMCRSASAENGNPPRTAGMPSHQLTDKIVKPRLPRKLAASARINLNRYWHALEELMPVGVVGRRPFDEADANAINDNIDNERRLADMRLAEIRRRRHADDTSSCSEANSKNDDVPAESPYSFPTTSISCSDAPMTPDENTPPSSTPGSSR